MTVAVPDGSDAHPVLALMALLGRRWALRVIYELHPGPLGFTELRDRCGSMSRSVLSTRLRDLAEAGVVEHDPQEQRYHLSDRGYQLAELLMQLKRWTVA